MEVKGVKMSKEGHLALKRKDGWKRAYCPYALTTVSIPGEGEDIYQVACGTWCPRFGEPVFYPQQKQVELRICSGSIWCELDSFTDEREEMEDEKK